ncbi:YggS family pyridoxal phosphate-dependent enzyme [Terrimonas sp. NA20]|uniref:Pyridoxal phosphate homeostasis protein n=1 Tax=Terrimonas ginsenosidimutans TaxID=2908004 RepID=A0ABS9KR97_9BACT|nr:YggS family pyridoxal phosphate-dependent enzyme [Terrimonas ginsenosidimutans]MCG2614830.1 YggS family pyridoxal phosphate-dependent enzyme [Terrimonas ginsenosidimutans]
MNMQVKNISSPTSNGHFVRANLAAVKNRIAAAALSAGRNVNEIRLLLATKTVSAELIAEAVASRETLIGENKVQELKQKDSLLSPLAVERHFIGHLQSNKIKDILKYVNCIQSVDRPDLIEKLDSRLQFEGRQMDIFIQVNTSFEESKFGISPDHAIDLLRMANRYETLNIKGLMTIGLFDADPEKVRPSFRLLQQISNNAVDLGLLNDHSALSMGMSGDLETAIEEGATIVRVGTAIFGKRIHPDSYYWNEQKSA